MAGSETGRRQPLRSRGHLQGEAARRLIVHRVPGSRAEGRQVERAEGPVARAVGKQREGVARYGREAVDVADVEGAAEVGLAADAEMAVRPRRGAAEVGVERAHAH